MENRSFIHLNYYRAGHKPLHPSRVSLFKQTEENSLSKYVTGKKVGCFDCNFISAIVDSKEKCLNYNVIIL